MCRGSGTTFGVKPAAGLLVQAEAPPDALFSQFKKVITQGQAKPADGPNMQVESRMSSIALCLCGCVWTRGLPSRSGVMS